VAKCLKHGTADLKVSGSGPLATGIFPFKLHSALTQNIEEKGYLRCFGGDIKLLIPGDLGSLATIVVSLLG